MKPTKDPDVLTAEGDLASADRIVSGALGRLGRIDTLINNAGVYISKPFTDYTARTTPCGRRQPHRILLADPAGPRRDAAAERRPRGQHLGHHRELQRASVLAALTKGGLASATRSLAVEYHGVTVGTGPPRAEVVVWAGDVDAVFADLSAKGVSVLSPPHDFLASLRATWIADPEGNPVQIVMRRASEPPVA